MRRKYLSRFSAVWALSAGLSAAQAQPPDKIPNIVNPAANDQAGLLAKPAPVKVDLSSPDSTLQTFTQALDQGDLKAAARCVVGAHFDPIFAAWEQQMQQHKLDMPYRGMALAGAVKFAVQGDTAVATQQLSLRREGLEWKIVPGDAVVIQDAKAPSLLMFSTMLGHPEILANMRGRSRAISCVSNLKQLALGALMLAQDNNEKFAFTAVQDWQVQHQHPKPAWTPLQITLMPYVKAESLFQCPDAQAQPAAKAEAVSYAFNAALDNVALGKIATPSQTVLLYEGKERQLDFRHDGRAGVAFADGHVRLVNAEEAKTLRWQP